MLFLRLVVLLISINKVFSTSPTASPTKARSAYQFITSVAGTGSGTTSGTGGKATSAGVSAPQSVWQDTTGTTFISGSDYMVRKFDQTTNILVNHAGSTLGSSLTSVAATSGQFGQASLRGDSTGIIYIADFNYGKIRMVANSILSTIAGTGSGSSFGDGGQGTSAGVPNPIGIWCNSLSTLYFGGYSSLAVRSLDLSTGIINVYAGSYAGGNTGDGGPATSATFGISEGMVGDTTNSIYIMLSGTKVIRKVSSSGIIAAFAGNGNSYGNENGVAFTSMGLGYVAGAFVDPNNGDFYVSDHSDYLVIVLTAATKLSYLYAGGGSTVVDDVPATATRITAPYDVFVSTQSTVYIAAYSGNKIFKTYDVTPTATPTISPTSSAPSVAPSMVPSVVPTTTSPSASPSIAPTDAPTVFPTIHPSRVPTVTPTFKSLAFRNSPTFKVKNAGAFAVLMTDGSVKTWGNSAAGGDSSVVSSYLESDVTEIVASKNAFAALKSDGSVVAWGLASEIVGNSVYRSYSTIVSLVATESAFAGVTSSGGVIAFGADCCGGNVDQYGTAQYLTTDVIAIYASAGAFTAVKSDGSVYSWGSEFAGGGVSSSAKGISDIVFVCATRSSFGLLSSDGSVYAWGNSDFGGDVSSVSSKLEENTYHIVSNPAAFVAYTFSEGLYAWGNSEFGGDSTAIEGSVASDIKYLAHTNRAFAALRFNGSVVVWGDATQGGDISNVATNFNNVTSIVGNDGAFAALNADGSVVAWGSERHGGLIYANVSSSLVSISSLTSTSRAFAALSSSGSVTVWGNSNFGGSLPSTISSLTDVKKICVNENAFTAIKKDGTGISWGYSRAVPTTTLSGNYSLIKSC